MNKTRGGDVAGGGWQRTGRERQGREREREVIGSCDDEMEQINDCVELN
jgi:hypothetical protein